MTTKTGTVKFFNQDKGFGFIATNDGSKDIFVHKTGIRGNLILSENDSVTFDIREGVKGLAAINVEKA